VTRPSPHAVTHRIPGCVVLPQNRPSFDRNAASARVRAEKMTRDDLIAATARPLQLRYRTRATRPRRPRARPVPMSRHAAAGSAAMIGHREVGAPLVNAPPHPSAERHSPCRRGTSQMTSPCVGIHRSQPRLCQSITRPVTRASIGAPEIDSGRPPPHSWIPAPMVTIHVSRDPVSSSNHRCRDRARHRVAHPRRPL